MGYGFLNGADLQRQTLRLYGELVARRESWAGKLVFACGEGVSATGLPAAVSLAGGTMLALDSDAARVKAVFRRGGLDFVVNSLDEALRVLKNEIRRHRPLSVGLVAEVHPTLAEMVERGMLPDLEITMDVLFCDPEVGVMEKAGMERLWLSCREGIVGPSKRVVDWLAERGWSETVLEAATTSALQEVDARLLRLLPATDAVRQMWVQRIGHYQRPLAGGKRVVWLAEAERAVMNADL